ncbi:hypothetical protein [Alkaliphilus peptidifermentans]|uniref:IseA DL-endopeptidase inhibitor n=1 Tax=Alkaliphilus peptidifermentans DSM 18978 TaxID=1120976 RepID=A0A1G5G2G2_9FIRM|nr:hypothetical protein [Alkaliphilus peptidifermentans]SCY45743.1 IseA DL-endopeptidase inhibitor [Alkaliphilus peptidifermentans DSM 18978]
MKKILFLLIVFLLFLPLWGCNTELQGKDRAAIPSIQDVDEAYIKAYEAFTWFEISTMPVESTTKEADGMIYNKVNHDTIKTYVDLENYFHSIFSQDIAEEVLNTEFKRYRDIDGELYGILADRGTDIYKGEEAFEVRQESDVKFIYTVEVELLGADYSVIGYESHEFLYELINGQWVFTNFYLFR